MKVLAILIFLVSNMASAQTISTSLPQKIKKSGRYLFSLHGGVVTGRGDMAVNEGAPEWGLYEYNNILDSLIKRGFIVISEVREKDVADSFYVHKIAKQIGRLMKAGVRPEKILVLGTSAGWDIGIRVAAVVKKKNIKYVMMGGCWPETYKDFLNVELQGHFLSIIESSDPHGTCTAIFENRKNIKSFKEIKLNTGLSHGFIYKAYKEWIDLVAEWFGK